MSQNFSLISVWGKLILTTKIKRYSHGSKNHVRKLNLRLLGLSREHISSPVISTSQHVDQKAKIQSPYLGSKISDIFSRNS